VAKKKGVDVIMSGATIIAGVVSFAIVGVWLLLAFKIIEGAIANTAVLDNIEGLLTALAVLTIPASKIVEGVIEKWKGEKDEIQG
tara:strand:- start:378 stop:632 length:255 start_codon:yes stop_codon:yes gene_type:complete